MRSSKPTNLELDLYGGYRGNPLPEKTSKTLRELLRWAMRQKKPFKRNIPKNKPIKLENETVQFSHPIYYINLFSPENLTDSEKEILKCLIHERNQRKGNEGFLLSSNTYYPLHNEAGQLKSLIVLSHPIRQNQLVETKNLAYEVSSNYTIFLEMKNKEINHQIKKEEKIGKRKIKKHIIRSLPTKENLLSFGDILNQEAKLLSNKKIFFCREEDVKIAVEEPSLWSFEITEDNKLVFPETTFDFSKLNYGEALILAIEKVKKLQVTPRQQKRNDLCQLILELKELFKQCTKPIDLNHIEREATYSAFVKLCELSENLAEEKNILNLVLFHYCQALLKQLQADMTILDDFFVNILPDLERKKKIYSNLKKKAAYEILERTITAEKDKLLKLYLKPNTLFEDPPNNLSDQMVKTLLTDTEEIKTSYENCYKNIHALFYENKKIEILEERRSILKDILAVITRPVSYFMGCLEEKFGNDKKDWREIGFWRNDLTLMQCSFQESMNKNFTFSPNNQIKV